MAIQHSAKSVEWGTPDDVLARIGPVDLDPASSETFNARVKARVFLTDGLTGDWPWSDLVLLNPPGNKPHEASMPKAFWAKAMEQRYYYNHLIWVGFTLEHLRHCQGPTPMAGFPFCIPRKRLRFVRPDGTIGKSPGHANIVVYVPGTQDRRDWFYSRFADLGACR